MSEQLEQEPDLPDYRLTNCIMVFDWGTEKTVVSRPDKRIIDIDIDIDDEQEQVEDAADSDDSDQPMMVRKNVQVARKASTKSADDSNDSD